jgi:hypothetical protein
VKRLSIQQTQKAGKIRVPLVCKSFCFPQIPQKNADTI